MGQRAFQQAHLSGRAVKALLSAQAVAVAALKYLHASWPVPIHDGVLTMPAHDIAAAFTFGRGDLGLHNSTLCIRAQRFSIKYDISEPQIKLAGAA
jgi:hypothetical protein